VITTRVITNGPIDHRLVAFDELMMRFVRDHRIPGGSLAVAREGRLVFARGYGYANLESRLPVVPASRFRIASLSKPITAIAILQLVEQNRLRLIDKVATLLAVEPYLPDGTRQDSRYRDITILQLLQHRGGWDREKSFDPMFRTKEIATYMGLESRAEAADVVRFMFGRPLDFDPGERCAYSNFGYFLLGRVIEKVTGEPYEQYVQRNVLHPLGITDMQIGATAPAGRADGEVEYYVDRRLYESPSSGKKRSALIPLPYEGWRVELMDANGGWIATAGDLVRIAAAFDDPSHSVLLKPATVSLMFTRPAGHAGFQADGTPRPVYYGCGWEVRPAGRMGAPDHWHHGSLDGTGALLFHRRDKVSFAVLFNLRTDSARRPLDEIIAPLLEKTAESILEWPEGSLVDG
jgi:N-acyl-D-amino-acid deacylase